MTKKVKILGIDPGTATTGYGIIEFSNQLSKLVSYGVIETPKNLKTEARLSLQRKKLLEIIKKYQPEIAAIEKIYFMKNIKTGITVAQARGVILETLHTTDVSLKEFAPTEIKLTLVGYGRADKTQIQKMVQQILNLEKIPKPDDAADALAAAICCAHKLKFS
jgi:crossover junction endodeoxyribonuclease RuvC